MLIGNLSNLVFLFAQLLLLLLLLLLLSLSFGKQYDNEVHHYKVSPPPLYYIVAFWHPILKLSALFETQLSQIKRVNCWRSLCGWDISGHASVCMPTTYVTGNRAAIYSSNNKLQFVAIRYSLHLLFKCSASRYVIILTLLCCPNYNWTAPRTNQSILEDI